MYRRIPEGTNIFFDVFCDGRNESVCRSWATSPYGLFRKDCRSLSKERNRSLQTTYSTLHGRLLSRHMRRPWIDPGSQLYQEWVLLLCYLNSKWPWREEIENIIKWPERSLSCCFDSINRNKVIRKVQGVPQSQTAVMLETYLVFSTSHVHLFCFQRKNDWSLLVMADVWSLEHCFLLKLFTDLPRQNNAR